MQKQSQNFVGRLALVMLTLSLTLSAGCNAWDALMTKADKEIAKAIAKADKKSEEAAEADKAEMADTAVRRLLGEIDLTCVKIKESQLHLSAIAKEVKAAFAKVAQAAPQPQTEAPTPTIFVGLVAVVVPAEKEGGEPQILPLYLVNNQALDGLTHQLDLVILSCLATEAQITGWRKSRTQLFEQLGRLDQLVEALWAQNPKAKNGERPVDFLGHVVEMHLDNEERAKVCAAAKGAKEPVPAWFEQASMLGLTPAAKKRLAE